jgi:antitoxin (DNA-binding transcriptional repressor) of toxin-antitoxin stability system
MKFISTKELRTSLPSIRKRLAKGEEFYLIHQSKPVARIIPLTKNERDEVTFEDIERLAIKDLGNDFLTKKEVVYYLSLDKV